MSRKSIIQNPVDQSNICKLSAEGFTINSIVRELKPRYRHINYKNVWDFIRNQDNIKLIEQYKAKYVADPLTVDIAQKKIRLTDLNRERLRIINTIDNFCKDDIIPLKKLGKYTSLVKRLVEIEIAGREEIERKPDLLELFQRTGPLAEKTTEELLAYDRELTIKLSAKRSRVPEYAAGEVPDTAGTQGPGSIEPA